MNWAKERRRKKGRKREILPPPPPPARTQIDKLHQFTLGIRLYLKKERRKGEGGVELLGMDGAGKIKIREGRVKWRVWGLLCSGLFYCYSFIYLEGTTIVSFLDID